MGRPEKSGVREMKPMVHALYPIAETGGPQRLIGSLPQKVASGSRWVRGYVPYVAPNPPISDATKDLIQMFQ